MDELWAVGLLGYFSESCYVLTTIVVFLFRKRIDHVLFKYLFTYLIVTSLTIIVNEIGLHCCGTYSCYSFSIHHFMAGITVILMYRSQLRLKAFRYLSVVLLLILVLVASYDIYAIYSGTDLSDNRGYVVMLLSTVILGIAHFFDTLLKPQFRKIQEMPFFWINTAFLIESGGILFLWLFEEKITWGESAIVLYAYLYPINFVASIIFCSIIIRSLWQKHPVKKNLG